MIPSSPCEMCHLTLSSLVPWLARSLFFIELILNVYYKWKNHATNTLIRAQSTIVIYIKYLSVLWPLFERVEERYPQIYRALETYLSFGD